VLDEPMSGLDLGGKRMVRDAASALDDGSRAIVLVTHDPADLLPRTSRIVMLKGGRIVSDGGLETLTERSLTELYGAPVKLAERDGRYLAWS